MLQPRRSATHTGSTLNTIDLAGLDCRTHWRVLAERNVVQTRELYENSKNTFQAMLESWQKSFGSAGQNAVALSRKMINLTGRNMDTGFNFAMGLAGARNLGEVMELQAAYWRKLAGALQIQPKPAARRNS